jgi:acetyl esterase/lipase
MNFLLKRVLPALLLLALQLHAGQPETPAIQKDVVYGKAGDVELKLDLAVPQSGDGPFPLLVFIHGGGWAGGSKIQYDGAIAEWAKRGYVAATVEYRFAPKYKFPAQVEDVKCAVRYLRSRAKELKINPEKVGACGDSAGGHLSLMLGLMDSKDGLEGESGHADQSSKVQAVVNYYGPTDFTVSGTFSPLVVGLVTNFLGTGDRAAPECAQASPITYVNKGDPPVLTFQGTKDPLVPEDQAKRLHEALKKAGIDEHLEIIQNGGHGFAGKDFELTAKMSFEFFEKNLKSK